MSDAAALPKVIPINEVSKKLNSLHFNILTLLSENEDLSVQIIQDKLNLKRDKFSKELAKLESALLVESYRNELDTRFLYYKITPYGLAALETRPNI